MRLSKLITVVIASVFILVVGLILNVAQLYWMSGVLLSLPCVGWVYALLQARGLSVRRYLPAVGRVGESIVIELEAVNRTALPKMHLWLVDEPPAAMAPETRPLVPLYVPPLGAARGSYRVRLLRRGHHPFQIARLVSVDPLGLSHVTVDQPAAGEILVYPRILPLGRGCLPSGARSGGSREELMLHRGDGATFHGIREYQPGDPLRRVHWRSSARWGRLAVVEFDEERACDMVIALETARGSSSGKDPDTSFELGVTVAASLASLAAERGYSVRLLTGAEEALPDIRSGGRTDLATILETLAAVEADAPHSLADRLPMLVAEQPGCVELVWITPLAEAATVTAARALAAARVGVTVLGLDRGSFGRAPRGENWEQTAEQLARTGARVALLRKGEPLARALEAVWGGEA